MLAGTQCQAAPRFDVFLGYEGILPERGWFPITCELQNDGPSFNAIIEVSVGAMGQGQTRRVRVDLPTGTLKRVVIPVFTSAQSWDVRLLNERGTVQAEQTQLRPRKVLPNDLPLVAGLCRTVQGLPTFPSIPTRYQASVSSYSAARLLPALFPDNPLVMEGIDLLYLNSEKALELTVPQATALKAWLENGGHLVVGAEQISDLTGNHWLRDLMPCDLTSERNLDNHPQLQDWLRGPWETTRPQQTNIYPIRLPPGRRPRAPNNVPLPSRRGGPVNIPEAPPASPATIEDDAQFEAAPLPVLTGPMRDGATLIGDDAAPLAVTAERGRGRITVLTFSPEREPFVSWKNRDWFWAKLSGIPQARLQSAQLSPNMARLGSDGIFGAMIDSKQVRKLPLSWLLVLLLAYLAVIGPLDQYCLKKINRQMLTWITFPVYVVAFSGLIYLIGFHLRAGELEWNELNVVDILPGTERAVLRGETYISIYSPANAHYPLGSSQPFATLRGEYGGNYGGGQETSRASVLQTGNAFQADAFVPVWTSQLYVSDWLQASPLPPLAMSAAKDASGWTVTVENKTERKLTHAHAVLDGRLYDLGELPAQQSKTFSLRAEADPVGAFAGSFLDSFRNAVNLRHRSFGNNEVAIQNPAEGAMAACFLTAANGGEDAWNNFAALQPLDLSRFAGAGHAILLAWDPDHSLVDALNRFSVKRIHRDTLLRLVVPVKHNGA
jgi:hypothetical protein